MLGKPKMSALERLQFKAAELRAEADRLDKRADAAEFSVRSQAVLAGRADKLDALITAHDTLENQRNELAERVGAAQRNLWRLNEQQANARIAVDQALAANDSDLAASHGLNLGALSLTAQRAAMQLADLQDEWSNVGSVEVDDDDRRNACTFRALSKSPAKSAAFMQAEVRISFDADLQELGRHAQAHPELMRPRTLTRMIDNLGGAA